jgi:hypothetical protein
MNNKRLSDIGTEVGELCEEKNEAYGDSFAKAGDILEALYPNGVQPHQYTDMLGIIRVVDKLFRIATRKDAFGESPWRDIAGYGILGAYNDQNIVEAGDIFDKKQIEMNCISLGAASDADTPSDAEINDEINLLFPMRNVWGEEDKISNDPSEDEDRSCTTCFYEKVGPRNMPCKKCLDKPFAPHYVKSEAVKLPGPCER